MGAKTKQQTATTYSPFVLRRVARCPECGARVAMPCRQCAVEKQKQLQRVAAEFARHVRT